MADAVTQFSTLSADAISYYIQKKMYSLPERNLVLGQFAERYTLPQQMSKTTRLVRYKRFSLPLTTLTEGTPPDAVALATENVDVTVEQWGIVALLTDVAQITVAHPALQIAIDRCSRAMTEMIDREIGRVLMGGTNVFYGTAAANRAALSAKYLITTDVHNALSFLRSNGASPYANDLFAGVMSPQQELDMMADTTFANAASYSQVTRLNVAEIGTWAGVRWSRSNFLPIFKGVGAPGTQTSEVSGYGSESGAGSEMAGSKITVIARDITTDFERKISQEKAIGTGKDSAVVTTPTSTNYVYDIYATAAGGATYKLLFSRVAANTAKTVSLATYAAGVAATPTGAPATDKEVFVAWVFGKEAFGRIELNGMSLQSYLTPDGASWSNPLNQGRKCGAKVMWKSFILEGNYFCRLESNSHYSANLPA